MFVALFTNTFTCNVSKVFIAVSISMVRKPFVDVITTLLLLAQPVAVFTTRSLYVVVTIGFTTGCAEVELKPDGFDDHEYVLLATAVLPMVVLVPSGRYLLLPASATGRGFTVILMESALLQPVAIFFSINLYVVVIAGFTFEFEEEEENPAGLLDHE